MTGRRALVCDDDPMVALVAAVLLRDEGFAVATVGTGAALADEVAAAPPDLVILDYELPDASAEELIPVIQAAAPDCQIILFSGRETELGAAVGVFARVPKRGTDELAAAIRRAASA